MNSDLIDSATLAAIGPFREAGFALHWLHPREKRPIGNRWSEAPVLSLSALRATHARGNNLGVRLGEPSALEAGVYLHVFDIDIRIPDLKDEAWEAMAALLPEVDIESLPCVASGSGGESRHLYFVSDKPFGSRKLALSEGKHRSEDGKWHYDWEIELFGTGKQVAMPPSIHPITGKSYSWVREFDFDALDMGLGPHVGGSTIVRLGAAESGTYEFETREPLTFEPGQMERDLELVPVSDLHYDDWIRLGQALHHQFGGSQEGLELWIKHTRRSIKFRGDDQVRDMRRSKWRSFGKYRGQPVTMATVRQWASEARSAALVDQFDGDDFDEAAGDDFDDLLGEPAGASDSFDEMLAAGDDDKPKLSWISLLDLNDEGAIRPTLHNLEFIIRNDARLVGLARINQFTQEIVQREPPGLKPQRRKKAAKEIRQLDGRMWNVRDKINGDLWSDDRDAAIRSILEAPKTQGGYGIKVSDRDLKSAVTLSADSHAFHPVREYLSGQKWDGVPRVEALFSKYFGAPDDAYTRSVSRMMMTGAVTRIFEPGHKFDFAVILEGVQGRGKSSFIAVLARHWFAELEGEFADTKAMIELMQGAWILEIPELSGFSRADVRSIKAFISRQRDRARLAYARRAGEFPRQCIFIGSTNDDTYLRDDTGGRRFWPVACQVSEIDIAELEREVDQLWAEACALYHAMRAKQPTGRLPLYLTDSEAKRKAEQLQESRRVETADDGLAGRIGVWLDRPVNDGGFDDTDDKGEPTYRNETCAIEIWVEALGGDVRTYDTGKAQMIGRAMKLLSEWPSSGSWRQFKAPYGRQRIYERNGIAGRREREGSF
jgi:predicted P-loop ATPase